MNKLCLCLERDPLSKEINDLPFFGIFFANQMTMTAERGKSFKKGLVLPIFVETTTLIISYTSKYIMKVAPPPFRLNHV